jgi:leader peptidase (prepilin peptidase)/N-methyltransferase
MYLFATLFFNCFLFIFGAAIGSFLNVLSDRLPNDESIMGRSHCEKCKHELAWYDLFPVLSFLFLKGKCRYCKTKLSAYYPSVEVITGMVFVLTWNFVPHTWFNGALVPFAGLYQYLGINLVIVSALLVIFFADLKYQIIPDSMHTVLIICAVVLHLLLLPFSWASLLLMLLEGLISMAPILFLFLATRGKGMGFGDVKLAFAIGLLFGLKLAFVVLYLSFLLGAIGGIYLIFRGKKKMKSKIAFGPFIVLSMFLALFFHVELLRILNLFWPFVKI